MTKTTTMSTSPTHYIMHGSNVTYNVDLAKSVNELKYFHKVLCCEVTNLMLFLAANILASSMARNSACLIALFPSFDKFPPRPIISPL